MMSNRKQLFLNLISYSKMKLITMELKPIFWKLINIILLKNSIKPKTSLKVIF